MLFLYIGLIDVQMSYCEVIGCKFTYNGHLSTFSRGVLLIPEALSHNFIKGEPPPE